MCASGSKETPGTATNRTSRTFVDTANPSKREKEGVETVSCGRSGDKKRVVKRDGSPGLCSTVGPSWTATCRLLHDIIALVSSSPDMTALGSLQQHQTATAKRQVKRWGRCESCELPHRDRTETRPLLGTNCWISLLLARLKHSNMTPMISGILPDLGVLVAETEEAKGRTEGAGQQRCGRILTRFETLNIHAEIVCRSQIQPYRAVK